MKQCKSKKYPEISCGQIKPLDQFYKCSSLCKDCRKQHNRRMDEKHVIYGLIDPNTTFLRYIGFTSNAEKRYKNHHSIRQLKDNTHKNNWIKSLIKNRQQAKMIIIAEYKTAEELPAAEGYWYAFFISHGADLTNDPNFIGIGSRKGKKLSEKHKKNISKANKGKQKSEEHKKNISESKFGHITTEKAKLNISKSLKGRKCTEEAKQKISKANKGKIKSEETKRKLSESHKGKIFSEEHKKKISEKAKIRCKEKPWLKPPRQVKKINKKQQ